MPFVSVNRLYQDNVQKLNLSWVTGREGGETRISNDEQRPTLALIGHLNFIHPNSIQVLGISEIEYLNRMEKSAMRTAFDQLFCKPIAAIIVANKQAIPTLLRDYCHKNQVALLSSNQESPYLMDMLRIYLARALAASTVLHGVFMDVLEIGVLITGESSMGKSELALDLISRGHGLVADDAVELYRIGPDMLEARCPALLRDFLEVRGLGVLNIRTVFGETAVRPKKVLKLIIHLVKANDQAMQTLDRLNIQSETQDILGVTIRKVILPVAAGRNLGVLVETAVRNYILQLRGIDSTREFIERHTNLMRDQDNAADSY